LSHRLENGRPDLPGHAQRRQRVDQRPDLPPWPCEELRTSRRARGGAWCSPGLPRSRGRRGSRRLASVRGPLECHPAARPTSRGRRGAPAPPTPAHPRWRPRRRTLPEVYQLGWACLCSNPAHLHELRELDGGLRRGKPF
jgi:hypothetical protein